MEFIIISEAVEALGDEDGGLEGSQYVAMWKPAALTCTLLTCKRA